MGFDKPAGAEPRRVRRYVSDPAKPVPFLPRPVVCQATHGAWTTWLVTDQRFVDGRADVLTYESEPLTAPVRLSGAPIVDLFAATSGTDCDWVVKLIDVYPDECPITTGDGRLRAADFAWISSAAAIARASSIRRRSRPTSRCSTLRAADREPRVPARSSDHGADPVELVSAVRPQSADVRAEHLLREAVGLPEGDAADLAHAGDASFIDLPLVLNRGNWPLRHKLCTGAIRIAYFPPVTARSH